jgi:hypothetical protein
MDAAIETFGRHRLLSFDRDRDTREPTVEIAHEALLREWARLRTWIDDAREELRQRARISAATTEWVEAERSSEYLMTGIRLAQAEEAADADAVRLTDDEREFLDASIAHRDAAAAAERMRHSRSSAERAAASAASSPSSSRRCCSPPRSQLSRSAGAARQSDGVTSRRSRRSPQVHFRTSTPIPSSAHCWRSTR